MGGPQSRRKANGSVLRFGAGAASFAAHLTILLLLTLVRLAPPAATEPKSITVSLVDDPAPKPAPAAAPQVASKAAPKAAAHRAVSKPPPPRSLSRPTRSRPAAEALPAGAVAAVSGNGVSEAELAGAGTADSGPSGRGCDMTRRVQAALRKDPLVQAAVAGAGGRALRVWDGDWVQSQGEDGKGLAAVREAIMWEVAFAPAACRSEPVHGLVLLSMNGPAGSARLVVGQGQWRWADLLTPRASGGG
jgi:hypothetical protein